LTSHLDAEKELELLGLWS